MTGNFRPIDLGLAHAEQAIIDRQFERFDNTTDDLRKEKVALLHRLDSAQRALVENRRLQQQIANLEALGFKASLLGAREVVAKLLLAEEHLETERWMEAIPVLQGLTKSFGEVLETSFDSAKRAHEDARLAWDALFPKIGPPDLGFLFDPEPVPQKAAALHRRGETWEACQSFRESMDHLEAWTSEVVSFNEKLADSARSAGEGVEILGVPFVSVKATLWSRFEIRVMDLARYVADDNPLSGESGSFWQQPGYPVGPTHPAVGITRRDAKAFCVWLGSQLNGTGSPFGRLPTQREWQRLAELEQVQ